MKFKIFKHILNPPKLKIQIHYFSKPPKYGDNYKLGQWMLEEHSH